MTFAPIQVTPELIPAAVDGIERLVNLALKTIVTIMSLPFIPFM